MLDYSGEPHGVFFLIDSKSFYASVECVARGLDPLKTPLVVMSEQENTNGGLILATSPVAKKEFGLQSNVSRQRDLPQSEDLFVVPPRMNQYIQCNLAINRIFQRYVAPEDLWPYSIDESILDITKSWHLFGQTTLDVAHQIQKAVHDELGIWTTVGIGQNPVQAKLALDLFAKHNDVDRTGRLTYATFPDKIWPITDMTSVWSIAERTAAHLARMNIHSMYDLAHTNPYALRQEMGLAGEQLFALAWGIDRAHPAAPVRVHNRSISNSQVLPRDYKMPDEIELVIKEIGEQVASRLRHHHYQCGVVNLGVGFSYASAEEDGRGGFHGALRIDPTNTNTEIVAALLQIFRRNWENQAVRNLYVSCGRITHDSGQQLSLLDSITTQVKNVDLERTVDEIRHRFGFTKLVYAASKVHGGTAIERASLVGGHNGGNAYD
jgi:DNA polymerase V